MVTLLSESSLLTTKGITLFKEFVGRFTDSELNGRFKHNFFTLKTTVQLLRIMKIMTNPMVTKMLKYFFLK